MSDFWTNVITNLVANLMAWLLLASGTIIGLYINGRSRRASLFRFFGINRSNPHVTVYLGTVFVNAGGAQRVDGTTSLIWQGPALIPESLAFIDNIPRLFHSTFADNLPAFARRWLSTKRWSFEPIAIEYSSSPTHISEIAGGPLICVASPYYNLATDYFLRSSASYIEFLPDHRLRVKRGYLVDKTLSPSEGTVGEGGVERSAYDLGVVSRLADHDSQRTVLIVAGTGRNGTQASLEYLSRKWLDLDKKFTNQDFAVILECPNRRKDPQGYRDARVTHEFPSESIG